MKIAVAINGPKDGSEASETPLSVEYEGRVTFSIIPAFEGGKQTPESAEYDWGDARHGIVGHAPNGDIEFLVPGHRYSRDDIAQHIEQMLR